MITRESKELKSPRNKCIDINGNFCIGLKKSHQSPQRSSRLLAKKNEEQCMEEERRQKLAEKLKRLVNSENGELSGGTLKVYGECLNPLLSYKSLLLSSEDTAEFVVEEMLDKYGIGRRFAEDYCLIMSIGSGCQGDGKAGVRLRKRECPWRVLMGMGENAGKVKFEVIKRPLKSKSLTSQQSYHKQISTSNSKQQISHKELFPPQIPLHQSKLSKSQAPTTVPATNKSLPNYEDLIHFSHSSNTSSYQYQPIYELRRKSSKKQLKNEDDHCDIDYTGYVYKSEIEYCDYNKEAGKQVYVRSSDSSQTMKLELRKDAFVDVKRKEDDKIYQDPIYVKPVSSEESSKSHLNQPTQLKTSIQSDTSKSSIKLDTESRLSRHLPIQITYFRSKESELINAILCETNPNIPQTGNFRLAPTYSIYLMIVDVLLEFFNKSSLHSNSLSSISACLDSINTIIDTTCSIIKQILTTKRVIVSIQGLWLSNCTELLHLIINNRLLSLLETENCCYDDGNEGLETIVDMMQAFRGRIYDLLAELAQLAFDNIAQHFRDDLVDILPVLFCNNKSADDPSNQDDQPLPFKPVPIPPPRHSQKRTQTISPYPVSNLIRTLSSCLSLLQLHSMNPALSIQLVSRLLHIVSCHSVHFLLSETLHSTSLHCFHQDAKLLEARLNRIQEWASRNDLSLAADCYLQPAFQMCRLILFLGDNRVTSVNLESLYSTCIDLDQLNSEQVRHILEGVAKECTIPQIWIDFVVSGVSEVADKIQIDSGMEPTLWPSEALNLPLLLPEDGYYIEQIQHGIPQGFVAFLDQLNKSWCFYKINRHQHAFYDWLVESNNSNEQEDNQSVMSEKATTSDSKKASEIEYGANYRHQIKFSDFKVTGAQRANEKSEEQLADSALESGIEIDRHCTGPTNNPSDPEYDNQIPEWSSDAGCSTTATSIFSELISNTCGHENMAQFQYSGVTMNTHTGHLAGVRELHTSVERGQDYLEHELEQLRKIEEQMNRTYEEKLEIKMQEFKLDREKSMVAMQNAEIRQNERIQVEVEKFKNQRELDRTLQKQRMDQIEEVNSARQEKKESFSNINNEYGSLPQYFVPITQAMHHSNIRRRSDRTRSQSVLGLSSHSKSSDSAPRFTRSLSSDRYNTLLTEDLDNLSFREKLDLFEFGISRSNR